MVLVTRNSTIGPRDDTGSDAKKKFFSVIN